MGNWIAATSVKHFSPHKTVSVNFTLQNLKSIVGKVQSAMPSLNTLDASPLSGHPSFSNRLEENGLSWWGVLYTERTSKVSIHK